MFGNKIPIFPNAGPLERRGSADAQALRVRRSRVQRPNLRRWRYVFVSQNVFINQLRKVNSPTKSSTFCLLFLIKILSRRFCREVDFLELMKRSTSAPRSPQPRSTAKSTSLAVHLKLLDYGLVSLGGVLRGQEMLEGHPLIFIHHQEYEEDTKINLIVR